MTYITKGFSLWPFSGVLVLDVIGIRLTFALDEIAPGQLGLSAGDLTCLEGMFHGLATRPLLRVSMCETALAR
jgi:hypothetical protein